MKRRKIIEIKRGYGLTELVLVDIGQGVLIASWVVPFIFLGIFDAPFFPGWFCYMLWIGLCAGANLLPRKKKRKRKFDTYDLKNDTDEAA